MAIPRRKPPLQHVLTVESTRWLGPHLIRVVTSAESIAQFPDDGYTDSYLKLVFVHPDLGLQPPYDLAALRTTLPAEQQPVLRTYTVRWVDRAAQRLAIDFVVHGDEGVAAPWATSAAAGDRLVAAGPSGGYKPDAAADWHVFAGDLSAVPAIAAALETLPDGARGIAHIEVESSEDIMDLETPSQVSLNWLVNPDPSDAGFLARSVDNATWPTPSDRLQVFAHGERESIKAIRKVLKARDVPREAISISGYWARGRTEDRFQAEKREPIGQID